MTDSPKPTSKPTVSARPRPQQVEVALPSFAQDSSAQAPNTVGQASSIDAKLAQAKQKRQSNADGFDWSKLGNKFNALLSRAAKRKAMGNVATDFPIDRAFVGRLKRYGPAKVYRLKGYTTVERVKRKQKRDQFRSHRNRTLFWLIVAALLILFLIALDPLPKLRSFLHDIGY